MATTNTKTVNTSGVTYDSTTNVAQNWIEVAPAGANIFAIQDNTLSASIKVLGTGDTIYIEGNFADYQYKQNGKTITMDNGIARVAVTLSSMTTKVQVTTTLVFLDGSVTLTNKAGGTRVCMNGFNDNDQAALQVLSSKYCDVKINANDSNTTAATYFATTEDAALVDQQNQALFAAGLEVYKAAHAETQVARAAAIEADNKYDAAAAAVIDAQTASVAEALAGTSIEASVRFEAAAAKELLVATELTRLAGLTTSTVDNALAVVATDEANAAVIESALATEYAIENEAAAEAVVAGYAELGTTFALTTGIDVATATVFDGSVSSFGLQTLNSGDKLTGELITGNSLDAQIYSSVTPANLTNIQTVEVTATNSLNNIVNDVLTAAPLTVGLINATGTTTLINDGSARDIVFTNVAASANNVTVQNTSSDTEVYYTSTTGAQTVNLTVSNVYSATAPAVPVLGYALPDLYNTPSIIIDGVETINIVSTGATNEIYLDADAVETVNISGAQDLGLELSNLTVNVSNVNASALTGDLWLDMDAQSGVLSTTVITVTSGQGDDNINTTDVTQLLNVTLGDGDDELYDAAFTVNDTVDGGLGFDALETTYATAVALGAATNNVNGIEELELSTALTGNLDLTKIDSTITELELSGDSGALNTNASPANVTGAAGTLTVELGDENYNGSAVLGGDLTFTDTGTAITDTLSFNNFVTDGNGTNLDVFSDQNITSTGYENVTINTGAASNAVGAASMPGGQNITDLTITADAASAPVSLVATGTNSLNIDALFTNSTGLTTVDASGLDVLATEDGLTLYGTTLGALGTESILGSAGMDIVVVGNFASTIDGAAGDDEIVGGTMADVIDGGTGNDTIASGGGNDVIRAGAGNDIIATVSVTGLTTFVPAAGNVSIDGGEGNDNVALFDTLTASDSVDGGTGVDTLYLSGIQGSTGSATGTTGVGIKNFEVLATNVNQTMSNFINNTGWTTVALNAVDLIIDNASATLNTVTVNENVDGGTVIFDRLTDTGTDSLTFATGGSSSAFLGLNPAFNGTITTLAVNDEESLTIDVSNGAAGQNIGDLTINNLNAGDLTSLTLIGDHAVEIDNIAQQTTKLTTINATGITAGSVYVNAQSIVVGITATGSAKVANTLMTGSGADSITGGSAADILTGNNGADTLIGAAGNDILSGGAGADQINAGTGLDAITAGTQADAVTLTVDGQTDTVTQGATDSQVNTGSSYPLAGGTFAIGDTVTFGNGVDVIYNFLAGDSAGGDVLDANTTTKNALLGTSTNVVTTGYLSGTYANGVFTVAANGSGPDTIVFQAGDVATNQGQAVVLVGVDSGNLENSNFTGLNLTTIVAQYAITTFNFAVGAFAIQQVTVAANGTVSAETGAAITQASNYSQALVTIMDFTALTGGFGVDATFDTTISTVLASVLGTAGDDTFTFSDTTSFNGVTTAVDGNGGIDAVEFTNMRTGATSISAAQLADVEFLALLNGTTDVNNTTQTLTLTGAVTTTVFNTSATANATVILGSSVGQVYLSDSSGVDTVTLGATAQTVEADAGNDVVNSLVANLASSTIDMGNGTNDTVNVTDNGTVTLRTTRVANTDTLISGVEIVTLTGASTLNLTQGNATAVTAGLAATTVNANGTGTVTVSSPGAARLLTLQGSSNFVANAVNTGGVTSTTTGTLAVVSANAAQTITSAGVTSIDATLIADDTLLTTAGAGAFTVTGLIGDITSTVTGSVGVTLADVATLTATNTSGGIMTINAAAMTDGHLLSLGAAGTGAYVVTAVSDSDVGTALSASTGGATITGTAAAAVAQNVFGTGAIDTITIVATTATSVSATTGAGADTISLTGTATNFAVNAGIGADTVTVGTGIATATLATNDTGSQNVGGIFVGSVNYDHYTGMGAGDILNLSAVTGGVAFTAVLSSSALVTGTDDDITFVRGTDVGGVFTASAAGTDTLVVYDTDIGTGTAFEAIVLVGSVVTGTDALALGVITLV